jgi:hypothetical protein
MKKLILILLLLPIYTVAQSTFGTPKSISKIYISLLKKDSSNTYVRVDGAAIAFNEGFTNSTYGPQDAIKFGSEKDNLYISDKGKNLSIDGRLPPTANDVIPLCISKPSTSFYQLCIDASSYTSNGFVPYIKDNYTGIDSKIIKDSIKINFNIDSNTNSYSNRFSIAFKNDSILLSNKDIKPNISYNNNPIFNTYPNPVINVLHIQPNNYMTGNSIIHIYSISGKLVLSTNLIFNKNILSINLDNIAHGEYILQIFSNHKLYTKTFVK